MARRLSGNNERLPEAATCSGRPPTPGPGHRRSTPTVIGHLLSTVSRPALAPSRHPLPHPCPPCNQPQHPYRRPGAPRGPREGVGVGLAARPLPVVKQETCGFPGRDQASLALTLTPPFLTKALGAPPGQRYAATLILPTLGTPRGGGGWRVLLNILASARVVGGLTYPPPPLLGPPSPRHPPLSSQTSPGPGRTTHGQPNRGKRCSGGAARGRNRPPMGPQTVPRPSPSVPGSRCPASPHSTPEDWPERWATSARVCHALWQGCCAATGALKERPAKKTNQKRPPKAPQGPTRSNQRSAPSGSESGRVQCQREGGVSACGSQCRHNSRSASRAPTALFFFVLSRNTRAPAVGGYRRLLANRWPLTATFLAVTVHFVGQPPTAHGRWLPTAAGRPAHGRRWAALSTP